MPSLIIIASVYAIVAVVAWAALVLADLDRVKSFALALLWPIAVPFFALLLAGGAALDLIRVVRRWLRRKRSHGL